VLGKLLWREGTGTHNAITGRVTGREYEVDCGRKEQRNSPGQSWIDVTSAFLPRTLKAYATPENVVPKSTAMTKRSSDGLVEGADMLGKVFLKK
jgi:hypothetical protein